MIVKVHETGGHSFVGLVEYLINEEGRVAWTETRNLLTDDPTMCARVMAATAMNQNTLKREAGIANTGRKPGGAVMHASVSWKEGEATYRDLSPDDMSGVVDTVLQNLGATKSQRAQYADEHQVVIVSHNDKSHPHLHLVINRVHPEHGVYLPTRNNWLKASGVALQYEREGGRIFCPNRAINWTIRKKGEYVRGSKETRRIWSLRKKTRNEDSEFLESAIAKNKRRDGSLYKQGRDLKARHRLEWNELSQRNKLRIEGIEQRASKERSKAVREVRLSFRKLWEKRFNEKEQAFTGFLKDESKLLGRLGNALKTVNFEAVLKPMERRKALKEAFSVLSSGSARTKAYLSQQNAKDADLAKRQKQAEGRVIDAIEMQRKQALASNRSRLLQERAELIQKQQADSRGFRIARQDRNRERVRTLKRIKHGARLRRVESKAAALEQRMKNHKPKAKRRTTPHTDDSKIESTQRKARLMEQFSRRTESKRGSSHKPSA